PRLPPVPDVGAKQGRCRVGDAVHRPQHQQAGGGTKIDETGLTGATIVTEPRSDRTYSVVHAKMLAAPIALARPITESGSQPPDVIARRLGQARSARRCRARPGRTSHSNCAAGCSPRAASE